MKKRVLLLLLPLFICCQEKTVEINVYLSANSTVLNPGETIQIRATIIPEEVADSHHLIWESSNKSVATVNNGLVTAVSPGEATITVSTSSQHNIANLSFRVRTPVSRFEFEKESVSIIEGLEEQVLVTISPDNADNADIEWSSKDESIASIDQNGVVTGVASGQTTIIATCPSWGIKAECIVNVLPAAPRTIVYTTSNGEMLATWYTQLGDNTLLRHIPNKDGGKLIYKDEIKEIGVISPERNFLEVLLPDGVEIISSNAFSSKSLESINFPESLKAIGSWAFWKTNLKAELKIPDSVTSLEGSCFGSCRQLESVTIGNGIDSIPNDAFISCEKLRYLEFGSSVKFIGDYAFGRTTIDNYKSVLDTVVFRSTTPPKAMIPLVFSSSRINATLLVPTGSKEAYIRAGWLQHFNEIIEY